MREPAENRNEGAALAAYRAGRLQHPGHKGILLPAGSRLLRFTPRGDKVIAAQMHGGDTKGLVLERTDRVERRRRGFLGLLLLGFTALAFALSGPVPAAKEPALPVSPLTIETAGGRFEFVVEMADTPSTWRQGLQWRRHLAADAGMLFNFREPRAISMWMKDTLIPLDMIFIDERGTVANVAENTVPLSLATINSNGLVLAVLEVNAGTAARLGMHPGDRVLHPLFSPQSRPASPK
jgi:uncharacterized protein